MKKSKFGLMMGLMLLIGLIGIVPGMAKEEQTGLSWKDFAEPGKEYRPLVRWWWPGNDVEEGELRREVDLLADNGFGGAEVQAFNAQLGKLSPEEQARVQSVDTESYFKNVAAVMEEAQAKGLLIDLTLGSGWPSGGSHIRPESALKTMFHGEARVSGPTGRIKLQVPPPQKPQFYQLGSVLKYVAFEASTRFMPEHAELITVLAARVVTGKRSKNPLNLSSSLVLDPASVQALVKNVDADGKIEWQVPAGNWIIISVYVCPDGQRLSLSASPEPAYVADYFEASAFSENLEHLLGERTGLPKFYGRPLRAFFNDSFELKTERFFTRDFVSEFQKRRGYDLTPLLPAVMIPGADNELFGDGGVKSGPAFTLTPEDRRIQYDYQLTVSDLFLERFIDNAEQWAEARGLLSRAQAYGLNIDALKALGHSGIPEVEQLYAGGYEVFLKMGGSAAHLYNRPVVACESMVWMGKPYMTTPLKFKASADKLFAAGVNQIIFHGFPYHKDQAGSATGWYPWGAGFSENVSETNPFWKFMPALNKYISRCQYLLRQGKPRADLLIYYPWFGFPTSFDQANEKELLFNGEFDSEPQAPVNSLVAIASKILPMGPDERARWRAQILPLIRELEADGYTWDWVNDDSLLAAKAENGKISIRGNQWKALLVVNIEALPVLTAQKLETLSRSSHVMVIGNLPSRQPGYKDFQKGDAEVQAAVKALARTDAAGLRKSLAERQVSPTVGLKGLPQVRSLRRQLSDGSQIIFLANQSETGLKFHLAVEGGCPDAQWLDPWNGYRYGALPDSGAGIPAELPPYGSMFLTCGKVFDLGEIKSFAAWPQERALAGELELKDWNLSVAGEDVAGKSFNLGLDQLIDWRELKQLKFSSSPGIYQAEFDLSQLKPGQKAILEPGWVYGAAEVKINGRAAGELLISPFKLDLTNLLAAGRNQIEIALTPALHNRLVGQGKGKDKELMPAGLIGPVKILILNFMAPDPPPSRFKRETTKGKQEWLRPDGYRGGKAPAH